MSGLLRRLTRGRPATADETGSPTPGSSEPAGAPAHAPTAPGPIPSAVVTFGDQPYALGWFEFLADGCQVFSQSVSSLQYVLSDSEREIHKAVLSEGPQVLGDAVERQVSTLADERRRISAHDALDSLDDSGADDADIELLASDERSTLAELGVWSGSVVVGGLPIPPPRLPAPPAAAVPTARERGSLRLRHST